jgi:glycosyltransferase involved in cell wall biosynthesis
VVFHYRERFYELLRERLADEGMELVLIHSSDPPDRDVWESTVELPWSHRVPARRFRLGSRELVWQPAHALLRGCEVVVVEQASRQLLNYLLLAEQVVGRRRVVLWGHGRNFNEREASRIGEWIKVRLSRRAHWWFAYNDRSAEVMAELGILPERITVLNNAVDTRQLAAAVAGQSVEDRRRTRRELAVTGHHTALYLGGLAPEKHLDYLLAACDVVRTAVPDFEVIVAGAGPEEPTVRAFAATRPWVHVVGTRRGEDKARILAISDLLLMPAAAGLVVLDSFAAGVPLVASSRWDHGPELAYVTNGVDGRVVDDDGDPERYAQEVTALLRDPSVRGRLCQGARAAATRYTVEDMVERFVRGLEQARTR